MSTTDFTTTILVDRSPSTVFDAVNNVSGWWQGVIEGNSHKLHDVFTYRMKEFHFSKQQVVELVPNQKIVWLVTESQLNFIKEKDEWTGTTIVFDITTQDDKTQLRFTHIGLAPQVECYGACSNGWQQLIQQSLYSFITTGKGKDVF